MVSKFCTIVGSNLIVWLILNDVRNGDVSNQLRGSLSTFLNVWSLSFYPIFSAITEKIKTSKKLTKNETIPIHKMKRIGLSILYRIKEFWFSVFQHQIRWNCMGTFPIPDKSVAVALVDLNGKHFVMICVCQENWICLLVKMQS